MQKEAEHPAVRPCILCGAPVSSGEKSCWMCGGRLQAQTGPSSPYEQLAAEDQRSVHTIVIAVIVIVAVSTGLTLIAPGLGGVFFVIATLALVAASLRVDRKRKRGENVDTGDKVAEFFTSALMIVALAVALVVGGAIALFCFCMFAMAGGSFL